MNEKELAAQLHATKDDADEWGDPTPDSGGSETAFESPAEASPKRRLAAMVSVRLSPEELESVQARAAELGESVSSYLRGLALRDISVSTTPFHLPIFVSSGETHFSKFANSMIVKDGGQLLTRAP